MSLTTGSSIERAYRASLLSAGSFSEEEEFGVDDYPLAVEAGYWIAKGDQRALAMEALDLEQVPSAEVFDRYDFAQLLTRLIHARQANQVGVIIFALFERRELIAVDFDQ